MVVTRLYLMTSNPKLKSLLVKKVFWRNLSRNRKDEIYPGCPERGLYAKSKDNFSQKESTYKTRNRDEESDEELGRSRDLLRGEDKEEFEDKGNK